MVVKTWAPLDCDFRAPLLKITEVSNQTGRVGLIQVEVITDLDQAGHLEDSLFRVPPGLRVEKVP